MYSVILSTRRHEETKTTSKSIPTHSERRTCQWMREVVASNTIKPTFMAGNAKTSRKVNTGNRPLPLCVRTAPTQAMRNINTPAIRSRRGARLSANHHTTSSNADANGTMATPRAVPACVASTKTNHSVRERCKKTITNAGHSSRRTSTECRLCACLSLFPFKTNFPCQNELPLILLYARRVPGQ